MNDRDWAEVLQWALPRLGLRWRGFTNLRRQVCRRMKARAKAIGLEDATTYRKRLEDDPEELRRLDALCFVTISRFYRDRATFDLLRHTLLPALADAASLRGERALRVWSAGCASGEEPYTLAMIWMKDLASRFPSLTFEVLATDFDATVLARAARGCYPRSSFVELPADLREAAVDEDGDVACVRATIRDAVRFEERDIRTFTPSEPQALVLCRNVAFTYFDESVQRGFLERVGTILAPGGLLVIGGHEQLPPSDFHPAHASPHVFAID
jgi:chemotaxis protein methyltransferase CheR